MTEVEEFAVVAVTVAALIGAGYVAYTKKASATAATAAYQAELGPEALQAQAGTLPLAIDIGSGGLVDTLTTEFEGTTFDLTTGPTTNVYGQANEEVDPTTGELYV